MRASVVLSLLVCLFCLPGLVSAQQVATQQPFDAVSVSTCNAYQLQTAVKLTFAQRACFYGEKLISPKLAAQSVLVSMFGQWRNSPIMIHQDWDDFPHRLAVFYARHSARNAGELLAGYLNHEDPRPHQSGEAGFWRRTGYAMRSVVAVQTLNGGFRPASASLGGALGSGLVGVACYRHDSNLESGFERSGVAYSTYFVSAFFREFKPDLNDYARRVLHRK